MPDETALLAAHNLSRAMWHTLAQLAYGITMTERGLVDESNARVNLRIVGALCRRGLVGRTTGTAASYIVSAPSLTPEGWRLFEKLYDAGLR